MNDKERFREALIARVHAYGISVSELARKTGVSKSQLDKLMQRRVVSTNVDDAATLARFFGSTVEEFMGSAVPDANAIGLISRIQELTAQLTEAEQDMLEAQLLGLLTRRGASR